MDNFSPNLNLILSFCTLLGIIFAVYLHFKNPQIKTDAILIKFQEDLSATKKQVSELKETHLRAVETDIKTLTSSVNDLSKTVVKLSTIIEERIARK